MAEFLDGKITVAPCKQIFFCVLFLYLSVAQSLSAPQDQPKLCEAQYQQCIKRITEAYTKNKVRCESSFRQCLKGKQR
jgi:hypothetical protein